MNATERILRHASQLGFDDCARSPMPSAEQPAGDFRGVARARLRRFVGLLAAPRRQAVRSVAAGRRRAVGHRLRGQLPSSALRRRHTVPHSLLRSLARLSPDVPREARRTARPRARTVPGFRRTRFHRYGPDRREGMGRRGRTRLDRTELAPDPSPSGIVRAAGRNRHDGRARRRPAGRARRLRKLPPLHRRVSCRSHSARTENRRFPLHLAPDHRTRRRRRRRAARMDFRLRPVPTGLSAQPPGPDRLERGFPVPCPNWSE